MQNVKSDFLRVMMERGFFHQCSDLEGLDESAGRPTGLAVNALGDWRIGESPRGGLLMGFANFATASEAAGAVRRLEAVVRALR